MREEVDQKTGEAETAGMLERRETGGITEEAVRRRALAGIRIGEKRARLRGRQKNCGFSFLQRKRTWKRKGNDAGIIYFSSVKAVKKLPPNQSIRIDEGIVNNLTNFLGKNNVKVVEKSIEKKA